MIWKVSATRLMSDPRVLSKAGKKNVDAESEMGANVVHRTALAAVVSAKISSTAQRWGYTLKVPGAMGEGEGEGKGAGDSTSWEGGAKKDVKMDVRREPERGLPMEDMVDWAGWVGGGGGREGGSSGRLG